MDKVNVSEPQESVEETIDSTEKISASALIKKKKGRIYGYFRIALYAASHKVRNILSPPAF